MKTININDYYGNYQEVPVTDEFYEEWRDMMRADDRIRKRENYHRALLNEREAEVAFSQYDGGSLEDELIRKENAKRLYAAISQLDAVEQRRVLLFMETMSFLEVAKHEGITRSALRKNLLIIFRKIRTLMGCE